MNKIQTQTPIETMNDLPSTVNKHIMQTRLSS